MIHVLFLCRSGHDAKSYYFVFLAPKTLHCDPKSHRFLSRAKRHFWFRFSAFFFSLYFVCDAKTDSVQKPTSARPLLEATVCACVRVYVSNSLWWICAHCVSLSNQKNQKSCFKISLFFQLLKGLTLVLKSTVAIKADTNRVEFATFI